MCPDEDLLHVFICGLYGVNSGHVVLCAGGIDLAWGVRAEPAPTAQVKSILGCYVPQYGMDFYGLSTSYIHPYIHTSNICYCIILYI